MNRPKKRRKRNYTDPRKELALGFLTRKFPFRVSCGGIRRLPKQLQGACACAGPATDKMGSMGWCWLVVEMCPGKGEPLCTGGGSAQVLLHPKGWGRRKEVRQQLKTCEGGYSEREELYSRNRVCLQHMLTSSSGGHTVDALKGFFTDSRHLRHHFEWLNSTSLA